MNSFFVYRTDIEKFHNILVCYVAGTGMDLLQFRSTIKKSFDKSPFSKQVVLISAEYNRKDILDNLLNNEEEKSSLRQAVNYYQHMDLHLISIGKAGKLTVDSNSAEHEKPLFDIEKHAKELIEAGLIDVIKRNNLVMESSPTYHFVKPSGKHSNKFIKATNVLQHGAEISFLAINLLQHAKKKISKIYTDTAGIFPLAYELISIKRRFGESQCEFIDSFGSYKGLEEYSFSSGEGSLVLISASTSDEMANKLKKKPGLANAQIVSVFSAAPTSSHPCMVRFINYYNKYKDEVFAHFKSTSEHECEMCIYQKSIPLSLNSSQFVFDAPKAELYLPLAKDSSATMKRIISDFKDLKAFKCLYDGLGGGTNETPEYFIDLKSLISNSTYDDKIRNYVIRHFPLSADLIIYANDHGAKELAERIQSYVLELDKKIICSSANEPNLTATRGIVVVAGSIQTGKSLLDISRKLRQFSSLPITYVVGFSKYNDTNSYIKLKNDLCHNNGSQQLGKHHFHAIQEIMLPINELRVNSWVRELEIIKYLSVFDDFKPATRARLQEREQILRQAPSASHMGIGEHIFLPSTLGKNMILGKTFAFWNEVDTKENWSHQATVYFTISNILQSLRHNSSQGTPPLKTGYVLKQLDPLTFDRFNEGVIQASLLRAAKPSELDYSASDDSSRVIGTLIERMLKYPELGTSEALPEFLLALCTSKLQIKKDHISFLSYATVDEDTYPLTFALLRHYCAETFAPTQEQSSQSENIPF